MAEALYRKYRPQVFEEVVGQEPIERTLKNAIGHDKVSHAYLFTGPRGTGKTTTARLLAKALLCEHGPTPDPDGTCEDCQLIAEGAHPDVYELDAASRTGVENVREEIISRVHFAPTRGRYKVYIIDEVHMLSTAAFNALLKTLEEPPSHVVFILCTTDPQKVPETIHSRCQRFDFHRISPESMVARLGAICIAEEVEFEGEALDLIAQRAEGGLRNALTSLEQIIAFENGKVTLAGAERLLGSIDSNDLAEIMAYVGKRDIANCFRWTAEFVETGADLAQFTRDMAEHVRNLYIMALVGDDVELEVSETARQQLAGELAWFGSDRAARLLGVLGDLMAELKTTSNPRLAFEVALTRMVRPDSDLTLEGLAERVEALEAGYSAVAHVLPGEPVVHGSDAVAASSDLPVPDVSDALRSDASQPSLRASDDAGTAQPRVGGERKLAPTIETAQRSESIQVEGGPLASEASQVEGGVPQPENVGSDVTAVSVGASFRSPSAEETQQLERGGSRIAELANPAALQRFWQAAMVEVKRQKQAYGVLFMNTKASFDAEAGAVVVSFPAESSFAFNAVQKPDVQDALGDALAKSVGEAVPFRFVQGEAQQAAASIPAAEPEPVPTPEPAPVSMVEPVPVVEPEPAPASAPEPVPEPAPTATADFPPYEEVPYEAVPYDEFDAMPAPASDVGTSASPADAHLTPNGAIGEDTAALQAMLQASFGDGVVLSEADE